MNTSSCFFGVESAAVTVCSSPNKILNTSLCLFGVESESVTVCSSARVNYQGANTNWYSKKKKNILESTKVKNQSSKKSTDQSK